MTPAHPSLSPARDRFAEFDAKIAQLLRQVHQLRVQRNQLPPINRMPHELLQKIMHHVKQDAMERGASYSWARVAHVCGHWREVALGCPTLWTTIVVPLADIEWVEELLRRSRSIPLSLVDISNYQRQPAFPNRLHVLVSKNVKVASILGQQLHRVQGLRLSTNEGWGRHLWSQLAAPAPALENLWINNRHGDPPILKNDLFAGSVPSLRSLHLDGCQFSWNIPLFAHSLQDLTIITPTPRLTTDQLPLFFASVPRLQTIRLEHALPDTPSAGWNHLAYGHGPIQIPSIRTLHLADLECSVLADFLSRIQHHDSLTLRLHCQTIADLQQLVDFVYPVLQRDPVSSYLKSGFHLSILQHQPYGESTRNTVSLVLSTPHDQILFELCFHTQNGSDDWPRETFHKCCTLVGTMPLQSLKRCTIGGDVPILESVFYKLSEVPCLEVLEFNGPDDGVIDFVADLVDNIPQCNAHKQVRECSRNFGFEKWTSQDSTDDNESDSGDSDWDSDGEEDDEASEGESGGSGEEGGGSDEDDQNRSGDSHQGLRSSNSNGKDGEKGNLQNPKNKDNDYQALCDDIDYCIACGRLGRLFFPALRKLVFRDFNLEKWWMVDDRQRRLHPITEFVVRRIRCGLRVEEIRYEAAGWNHDLASSEKHIRTKFSTLCKDSSPSIWVEPCAPPDNDSHDSRDIDDLDDD